MSRMILLTSCVFVAITLPAAAEVTTRNNSAFTVQHEINANKSAAAVYAKCVDIGSWWSPDHTWSGKASNLSLDPKPGGLFVEHLPNGGFAEHMRVISARPGEMLRMQGALGPLQEFAVTGVMSISFVDNNDGCTITVTYRLSGALPGDVAALSEVVDRVIGEQFTRLKSAIEDGEN